MSPVQSAYGRPGHALVLVRDLHFVALGLLHGDVDPEAGLAEVLEVIEGSGLQQPEAVMSSEDPGVNLLNFRAAEPPHLVYEQLAGSAAPGVAVPGAGIPGTAG
jgi:hypothetical protein